MPKSAKRRKEKVADFSKAKLKLGKGKTPANNAIDTSFKARSIVLPSQSIAIEKDDSEPITKRQLTFSDLLSHLKHYNAGTRKDAILGLRELFDSHWEMVDSCLAPLLNAIVRLIGDEDAGVRKQLITFFSWLLPRVSREDLVPHFPLLLLYTTSAQTHIFPEIRVDAIRFLDILLECIPETLTSGWRDTSDGHGSRVLGGYLGILNAGTKYGETGGPLKATSTASVVLTPASKLVVLRSLSKFLLIALSSSGDGIASQEGTSTNRPLDAWFMRNAFSSPEAFSTFESLFGTSSSSKTSCVPQLWRAEVDPEDDFGDLFTQCYPLINDGTGEPWTLHELSDIHDVSDTKEASLHSKGTSAAFVAHLANTLHSTIIETYLDFAPAVFSPSSSPSETEVQLVLTVVRIARTLYHVILQSSEKVDPVQVEQLEKIVNYMAPYFPTFNQDHKFDQLYEEFDLIFCELTSILVNATRSTSDHPQSQQKQRKASRKGKAPSSSSTQTERVTMYITRRLRGEGTSGSQIATPISPAGYLALLPTVWALASNPAANRHEAGEILHATLDHALKVTSKSACKRTTVEFVARLMLLDLEPYYRGDFSSEGDPEVKAKFDAWLLHLPQVLWEVGSSNIPTVEVILRVLLRVLQRRSRTTQSKTTASLQSRLVPYFYMDHPSRGPLAGPFKKLPPSTSASRVRHLALDVVATLLVLGIRDGKDFGGLARAVGLAVTGEEESVYWSHTPRSFLLHSTIQISSAVLISIYFA